MRKYHYFKVYKPYGTVSHFTDPSGKPTLADIFNFPPDVYSAGRLDHDSEGLLLLTNDKRINSLLFTPGAHIEKEYLVQVEGSPIENDLLPLRRGVEIEGKLTLPAKAEIIEPPQLPPRFPPIRFRKNIPETWLRIVITEGRNRQVRKMTAKIGFPTLRLVRIRIKDLQLGNISPGEVKDLSNEEIEGLFRK